MIRKLYVADCVNSRGQLVGSCWVGIWFWQHPVRAVEALAVVAKGDGEGARADARIVNVRRVR